MIPGRTFSKPGYYDASAGKVHTGQRMPLGMNTAWYHYWNAEKPFINLVKGGNILGNPTAVPGTVDSNGYIDASSSGSWSIITHSASAGWWRQTDYVLTWDGVGDCTWSGGTPGTTGTKRREYNVATSAPGGNIIITCTGKPVNIRLFYKDEEARIDDGNVLNQSYIDYASQYGCLRMINWQAISGSFIMDYSDIQSVDDVTWYHILSNTDDKTGNVPMEIIAKAINEIGCDLWIHTPHQATDACITAMYADLETHLDPGTNVYCELSNEIWNGGNPWADEYGWLTYDTPSFDATVVPATATCTLVGHGLTTGDQLIGYNNRATAADQLPWVRGYSIKEFANREPWLFAIVDDANNFRLCNSTAAAARGADCNDTLDADYDAFNDISIRGAAITLFRYKVIDGAAGPVSGDRNLNIPGAAMNAWDLAEAAMPSVGNFYRVHGGQAVNDYNTQQPMTIAGYRAAVDYASLAPYFNIRTVPNYWLKTYAQVTAEWIASGGGGLNELWAPEHVAAMGCYRITGYEMGDHNNGSISISIDTITPEKTAWLVAWARDPAATDAYEYYLREYADLGMGMFVHYMSISYYDHLGDTWGAKENPEDITAAEYLGLKQFTDVGGVSKT